ncbi:MAG TPA: CRISPR-associated protein Csx20 [Spirochaetota bacterium]|nr:CRISPR-associated protein Csx20 [Spirochaetota bacterium]HQO03658.1 CRISPR-associated protein Csx20 [Spirochaetota bacterium]
MPDLFLLISHELTETQRYEAAEVLGCERIISLPVHLQTSWSNVDSEVEDIGGPAAVFIGWLESNSREGDFCHIQGDFGMTFLLVDWALKHGREPVYSSTERVFETHTAGDGAIVNTHRFRHVRFRHYRTYG